MTDPREPDRTEQAASSEHEPSTDWRGSWKQAADGTWYQDTDYQESEAAQEEPRPRNRDGGKQAPETPEAPAPAQEATEPPQERRTEGEEAKPRRGRSKWTTVGFVVVAGLLVFALVRALTGTGNQGALNTGAAPPAPARPPIVLGNASTLANPPEVTLNPGLIRQGTRVGVTGIGFDPGSFVDLQFTPEGSNQPIPLPGTAVGRDGSFTAGFVPPPMPDANGGVLTAAQRGSPKVARADAPVQAGVGGMGLNFVAGRPGDLIAVTANGFQPGEKINAYWGRIGGPPAAQLQADPGGGLAQAPMRVGVAPAGNATLILVGDQSKVAATSQFSMIGLYPNVGVQPYAVKPGQPFAVGGNGFMPGERVLLYINNSAGPPVTVLQADQRGIVGGASFVAPYRLKGKQTLSLIGEQSRATAVSGFQVLPYTPMAQPSTWGGMPGTSMSFYASGFAPNEVVLVYAGRGPGNPGQLVSAFRVDARGAAAAAGHYTLPSTAQGMTSLQLVGRQSEATATATLSVQGGGVHVPPPPPYVLPPELAQDPPAPGEQPPPAPAAPPRGPR